MVYFEIFILFLVIESTVFFKNIFVLQALMTNLVSKNHLKEFRIYNNGAMYRIVIGSINNSIKCRFLSESFARV
ncbi:hypothetical protein PMI41_03247 [Phyllobacterium sp. YR531]|nr:hypothetical protein PMI41_03247 [Phyllobacterium sp. YR531]